MTFLFNVIGNVSLGIVLNREKVNFLSRRQRWVSKPAHKPFLFVFIHSSREDYMDFIDLAPIRIQFRAK